jgi:hypothetical protein
MLEVNSSPPPKKLPTGGVGCLYYRLSTLLHHPPPGLSQTIHRLPTCAVTRSNSFIIFSTLSFPVFRYFFSCLILNIQQMVDVPISVASVILLSLPLQVHIALHYLKNGLISIIFNLKLRYWVFCYKSIPFIFKGLPSIFHISLTTWT